MWHTTCMHVNQGNSWLLVVGSQIDTLTFGPFSAINCVLSIQMNYANPF